MPLGQFSSPGPHAPPVGKPELDVDPLEELEDELLEEDDELELEEEELLEELDEELEEDDELDELEDEEVLLQTKLHATRVGHG